MILSVELAEATGLSVRTLQRWAERGLIPRPRTRAHPCRDDGGWIGFWPDWVLGRVRRIQELRREGVPLAAAARLAEAEHWKEAARAGRAQLQRDGTVRIGGEEVDVGRALAVLVVDGVQPTPFEAIADALAAHGNGRRALDLAAAGGDPVLVWDGAKVDVLPRSGLTDLSTALVVVPLQAAARQLLGDPNEAAGAEVGELRGERR